MSQQLLTALVLTFILCTLICLIGEGMYMDTDPTDVIGTIMDLGNIPAFASNTNAVIAILTLPLTFVVGLFKMVTFQYSFFELNPALKIVQFVICYPLMIGILWAFVTTFLPSAIQSLFNK
jgi:uncharacterized membrane-anchored protein